MEWHAGTTLSQTVFTFLFVYHLDELDPDLIPEHHQVSCKDPSRPLELVTLVLRAAVFGLLKCCDLSWRELMRGGMHDVRGCLHLDFSYHVLMRITCRERIGKAKNATCRY
jgi:hypothetical protein